MTALRTREIPSLRSRLEHRNLTAFGVKDDDIRQHRLLDQKLPARATGEAGAEETPMFCGVAIKQADRVGRDASGQRNVESQQTLEW